MASGPRPQQPPTSRAPARTHARTAPEHVAALLERMRAVTGLPLVAYPNRGRVWDGAARCWTDPGAAHLQASAVRAWVRAGARLVGGCCGLGPDAIRALASDLGAPATRP